MTLGIFRTKSNQAVNKREEENHGVNYAEAKRLVVVHVVWKKDSVYEILQTASLTSRKMRSSAVEAYITK